VVDDEVVDRTASGGEAQAKLGRQGLKESWKVSLVVRKRIGGRVGRKNRAEAEREVVVAGEAGLVDDGASIVLQHQGEKPGEIDHRDADSGDVCRRAVDGDLVVFWGCVGLQLEAGGVDGKSVDVALADVVVEAQAETVGEKILVHGVEVIDGVGAVSAGFDVEALGIDPVWTAFDLADGDLVHQRDHETHGDILRGIAVIAGDGFDAAVLRVRVGWVDRDDVEGEARSRSALREQAGPDEERRELHEKIVASPLVAT